jgi:hypothetical protein
VGVDSNRGHVGHNSSRCGAHAMLDLSLAGDSRSGHARPWSR